MIFASYYSKRLRRRIRKRYKNIRTYLKARRALRRRGLFLKRPFRSRIRYKRFVR